MRRRVLWLAAGAMFASMATGSAAEPGAEILNETSYWRWRAAYRKPTVASPNGKETLLRVPRSLRTSARVDCLKTDPPPPGWRTPDFADADWPRSRATWFDELACNRYSSSLLCMRGKFRVSDPDRASGLTVSARYRGGVVVYLNGREVARGHMPAGPIEPHTPALMYPEEAYVGPDGKIIPGYWDRKKLAKDVREELERRLAARWRRLGPVGLPAGALRPGVNVLAVELHRSDYHPAALKWMKSKRILHRATWVPMWLGQVTLRAKAGVAPNTSRPAGLQVWNHDRNDRVTAKDYGDPTEPLRPVEIVAARNGSFCGQFVVGSDEPIRGLRVVAGDLRGRDGKGSIGSSEIALLFGRLDGRAHGKVAWFDGLHRRPPKAIWLKQSGAAVQPVLVRVHVPKETRPGAYRGTVTVRAGGARRPVAVPLRVDVIDWVVPDPQDFRTYMGIYQSPTSVAMQYDVEPWSEEHWALLDRSFALLARVGNKLVNIHAVDQTQFGNDRGMITWVRKADGTFDYDFSVVDRYLKLATTHCGVQDYVAVHVWHAGGWSHRGADQKNTVTVRDAKTGELERMQVPTFGTAESKRFWRPVLAAVHRRLKKLGMADGMCLGILSDSTAPRGVFRMFDEIWPGGGPARWMRGCHGTCRSPEPYRADKGGGLVILHEHCYGMSMASPTTKTLPGLWRYRGGPGTAYFRVSGHKTAVTLVGYRTMAERALWVGKQGVGRICLDFWPVIRSEKGRRDNVYNRYPHSSCAQREPSLKDVTWPGPNGAATTLRYEAIVEGLQEADAMIVLSEAVDKHADRLGADLAAACRRVLRDRLWYCHTRHQMRWQKVYYHMNHHGWQDLSRRLLTCAAKVTDRLGR